MAITPRRRQKGNDVLSENDPRRKPQANVKNRLILIVEDKEDPHGVRATSSAALAMVVAAADRDAGLTQAKSEPRIGPADDGRSLEKYTSHERRRPCRMPSSSESSAKLAFPLGTNRYGEFCCLASTRGNGKWKPRPEVGSVRVITKGSALGGYRQGSKARPGRWRCCAAGSIMRCGGLAAKVPRVARRHGSWSGAEHTAGRRNDGPVRLPPSISRAARHTNKDVARLLNMGLPLVQSARKTLPVICSTGKKLADAFNAPVQDLPLQAIGRVVQIASGVITMKTILSALERPVGFGRNQCLCQCSRRQDLLGSTFVWLGREGNRFPVACFERATA